MKIARYHYPLFSINFNAYFSIMYTAFHSQLPQERRSEILESINTVFRNKAITTTVEEDINETAYWLKSTQIWLYLINHPWKQKEMN